jgi:hypothetical protein
MRILFFLLVLAAVGLVITGAVKLQRSGDNISIEIDKKRVAEDARGVVNEGRELLESARSRLDKDNERN